MEYRFSIDSLAFLEHRARSGTSRGKRSGTPSAPLALQSESSFLDFVASFLPVPADRDRSDGTRVFLFRDKSGAEKSPRGGRRLPKIRRNRFRYELSLFLHSHRTCTRARVVLEGAGRCTRARPIAEWAERPRGAGGGRAESGERLHRVSAMQWKGWGARRDAAAGRGAPRVGKFRSRLDILALTTCIGRAAHARRAHRIVDAPLFVAALAPRELDWRETTKFARRLRSSSSSTSSFLLLWHPRGIRAIARADPDSGTRYFYRSTGRTVLRE